MKDALLNIDVDRLWEKLKEALGEDFEPLARESGFVARSSSRLTGEMMCYLNICMFRETQDNSLNDLCLDLNEKFGVELKKQSLDERFNTYAVKFMLSLYKRAFQGHGSSLVNKGIDLCPFSEVKVVDATNIRLPAHLDTFYVGSGGNSSASCCKVHYSLELLKGKSDSFYITNGASNDTAYWDSGQFDISQGGLVIFDLGYWRGVQLAHIAEEGAYFLSRYKANISLYGKVQKEGRYEKIDLMQLLGHASDIEGYQVCIGQEKVGARLIIEPVPERVKEQRLKNLKKDSIRRGRKSNTALREKMCGYNLWLTNAPETMLVNQKIRGYYGLRWQIELIFKIWKSLLRIDKVERMNIFRFECYLYGSLIAVMFSTEILSFIQTALLDRYHEPIEISEWKAIKIIKKKSA